MEVGYLRKTARGASSPAKPALHIPELEIGQPHDLGILLVLYCSASNRRAAAMGCGERGRLMPAVVGCRQRAVIKSVRQWGVAYPLSMTRAATSSAKTVRISNGSLRIHIPIVRSHGRVAR